MEEKIRRFIEETFMFEFGEEITTETDLFKAGVIDSFGYMQLMQFLDSEFGVRFADEELLSNILVSYDHLIASVRARMATLGVREGAA